MYYLLFFAGVIVFLTVVALRDTSLDRRKIPLRSEPPRDDR
jgi:hypothetical protein